MSARDQALLHPRRKENYSAISQRNESNLRSNHHSPALIKSSSELSPLKEKKMCFEAKLQNLGPCSPKTYNNQELHRKDHSPDVSATQVQSSSHT